VTILVLSPYYNFHPNFHPMSAAPDPFVVRIFAWPEAKDMARPLREAVFVLEQGVPLEEEWDEWDEGSAHAIASGPDQRPIGTGRLLPASSPGTARFEPRIEARIGRMAVLKAWRGRGVGAALLKALLDLAAARGVGAVVLHAQTSAVAFYRQSGFETEGGEFLEAGIPHVTMRLTLPRR